MKTVFVNPERCVGCRQCELACAVEHSRTKELSAAIMESPPSRARIHVEASQVLTTYPNKCRHCSPAPCVEICPTSALVREQATDTVQLIPEKCIACAMCAMVCPFDVIVFDVSRYNDHQKLMNIKCDNCLNRQRAGRDPACVETCKVGALVFGDINEIIRDQRKKFSRKVSVALQAQPSELTALPENVQMWRGWEKSAQELKKL